MKVVTKDYKLSSAELAFPSSADGVTVAEGAGTKRLRARATRICEDSYLYTIRYPLAKLIPSSTPLAEPSYLVNKLNRSQPAPFGPHSADTDVVTVERHRGICPPYIATLS